jgi:hypothetical protein
MSRTFLAALALASSPVLAGCEPEPCPKDQVLGPAQTPCDCDGAIVEAVACGNLVCSEFGIVGTTLADTGCTGTSTSSTTP